MFNPLSNNATENIRKSPLKTSENLRFSDVFREHRSETLVENCSVLSKTLYPSLLPIQKQSPRGVL